MLPSCFPSTYSYSSSPHRDPFLKVSQPNYVHVSYLPHPVFLFRYCEPSSNATCRAGLSSMFVHVPKFIKDILSQHEGRNGFELTGETSASRSALGLAGCRRHRVIFFFPFSFRCARLLPDGWLLAETVKGKGCFPPPEVSLQFPFLPLSNLIYIIIIIIIIRVHHSFLGT